MDETLGVVDTICENLFPNELNYLFLARQRRTYTFHVQQYYLSV